MHGMISCLHFRVRLEDSALAKKVEPELEQAELLFLLCLPHLLTVKTISMAFTAFGPSRSTSRAFGRAP